jgi:hypothetical protein
VTSRGFAPSCREEYVTVEHPSSTPRWAIDLTIQVLEDEAFDGIVHFIWRRNRGHVLSSGHVKNYIRDDGPPWNLRLVPDLCVTAGYDRLDQRHTLLHEIAHILCPDPTRGHNKKWAECAWRLYRKYGGARSFGHHALREVLYKPSSLRATGAPTARDLLRAWKQWPHKHRYQSQKEAQIIAGFSMMAGPHGGLTRRSRRGAA